MGVSRAGEGRGVWVLPREAVVLAALCQSSSLLVAWGDPGQASGPGRTSGQRIGSWQVFEPPPSSSSALQQEVGSWELGTQPCAGSRTGWQAEFKLI